MKHRIKRDGTCECCGLTRSELREIAKVEREKKIKREREKANESR